MVKKRKFSINFLSSLPFPFKYDSFSFFLNDTHSPLNWKFYLFKIFLLEVTKNVQKIYFPTEQPLPLLRWKKYLQKSESTFLRTLSIRGIYIYKALCQSVTFCLSPGGQTICLSPGGQTFFTHRWRGGDKQFWHMSCFAQPRQKFARKGENCNFEIAVIF